MSELELLYITDEHGTIVSVDDVVWNLFIERNGDLKVDRSRFPDCIGHSLFEFISDVRVQSFYRHILAMMTSGMQRRFNYYWFCDAPGTMRKLSMTVCRASGVGSEMHVLWISKIIEETPLKVPMTYLECTPASVASTADRREKPTRTVCSFCKRILIPAKELDEWSAVTGQYPSPTFAPAAILPLHQDGVPVIGLRGKLGHQIADAPAYMHQIDLAAATSLVSPPPSSPSASEASDKESFASSTAARHTWLTPEQYYSPHRSNKKRTRDNNEYDDLLVNHGICEVCYTEIANYFIFPALKRQRR